MKVNYKNQYKRNGKVQFVYTVTGTESELDQYAEAKGDYLVTDDESGQPLWFSRDYIGESGSLIFTSKGGVVADMAEFEKAASLASRFGGNLGSEIAAQAVAKLMSTTSSAKSTVKQVATPVAEVEEVEFELDADKLDA